MVSLIFTESILLIYAISRSGNKNSCSYDLIYDYKQPIYVIVDSSLPPFIHLSVFIWLTLPSPSYILIWEHQHLSYHGLIANLKQGWYPKCSLLYRYTEPSIKNQHSILHNSCSIVVHQNFPSTLWSLSRDLTRDDNFHHKRLQTTC